MAETTRHTFCEELKSLEERTLEGLDMVVTTLDRTLEAIQHQDIELASLVIADDDRIDGRYLDVHQGVLSLLARQAPVATDLRLVAAILHVIRHVERMGDQCVNICKLLPLEGHDPPRRQDMLAKINREVCYLALDIGDDIETREWAMHMLLVGRALERIGDISVDIGEQVAFVVTGLFREFTDASHPELELRSSS